MDARDAAAAAKRAEQDAAAPAARAAPRAADAPRAACNRDRGQGCHDQREGGSSIGE